MNPIVVFDWILVARLVDLRALGLLGGSLHSSVVVFAVYLGKVAVGWEPMVVEEGDHHRTAGN